MKNCGERLEMLLDALTSQGTGDIERICAVRDGVPITVGYLKRFHVGHGIVIIQHGEGEGKLQRQLFFDEAEAKQLWSQKIREYTKVKLRVEAEFRAELEKRKGQPLQSFPWGNMALQFKRQNFPIFHNGKGSFYSEIPEEGPIPVDFSIIHLDRQAQERLMEVLDPARLRVPDVLASENISFSFPWPKGVEGPRVVAILDPSLRELIVMEKARWIRDHGPLQVLDPTRYEEARAAFMKELERMMTTHGR